MASVPGAGVSPGRTPSPRLVYTVIALCTAAAALLRFYQLTRPGYLLGVTEYDDGVQFGDALRLVDEPLGRSRRSGVCGRQRVRRSGGCARFRREQVRDSRAQRRRMGGFVRGHGRVRVQQAVGHARGGRLVDALRNHYGLAP